MNAIKKKLFGINDRNSRDGSLQPVAPKTVRKTKRKGCGKNNSLTFDRLESRQMLTGDFVFAATQGDNAVAIVTDSAGNVYSTGKFSGTTDFDPGPGVVNLTESQNSFAYLSKLDAAGNLVWAKHIGGYSGISLVLDGQGNIYVAGQLKGTSDFDPNQGVINLSSVGDFDACVSKLSATGNLIWARNVGSTGYDHASSIAVDGLGNVFVGGDFSGTADLDPGLGTFNRTAGGDSDVFVLKLNSVGTFQWAATMGGPFSDNLNGLAVDGFGSVLLVGGFAGTADFDPSGSTFNLVADPQYRDGFVAKLDSDGNFEWAQGVGGTSIDDVNEIVLDSGGNMILGGYFDNSVDFDPGPGVSSISSRGQADIFILKLDRDGNFVWVQSQGGNGEDKVYGLQLDSQNNVYTTGTFNATADFDPGPGVHNQTSSSSIQDAYVSMLDANGNFVWAKSIHGDSGVNGYALALDSQRNVFAVGNFSGSADFRPGPGSFGLTAAGSTDGFIVKLTQDFILSTPQTGAGDWVVRLNGAFVEIYDDNLNSVVDQRRLDGILGVEVNGAANFTDKVTVDFAFGGIFDLRNGIRFNGGAGTGDTLRIIGTGNEELIYKPATTANGVNILNVSNSLLNATGVESLIVNELESLVVKTQNSLDDLSLAAANGINGAQATRISGNSGGVALTPLTWSNVPRITIDTGAKDVVGASSNDTITIPSGSLQADGMSTLIIDTGRGADVLNVYSADLGLPAAGGSFLFLGGAGVDRISVSGDSNWWINDFRVTSSSGGSIAFENVDRATIVGGASNNSITGVGFSGEMILLGLAGNDTIWGGPSNDSILGGDGHDFLSGYDGDDMLYGQNEDDRLFGGAGNDVLNSGTGNNWLFGGDGNDTLLGGIGIDILAGQLGNDTLNGGTGLDLYWFEGTNNAEELRLQTINATSASFVRRPRGLGIELERDSIVKDASDQFLIQALDGDDLITIDLTFANLGSIDGGNGIDTCTAPANWTKVSC